MIKSIRIFFLAGVMIVSMTAAVFGASASMSNFQKTQDYSNTFSDVKDNAWYAEYVQNCYEYGLMNGSNGKFLPSGTLTVAEAVTMAVRTNMIYEGAETELPDSSPWYQSYVNYAIEKGMLEEGKFEDYTAKIARSEMAEIFAASLPKEEFKEINVLTHIPDMKPEAKGYEDVFMLYKAGVLTGEGVFGDFYPNYDISRAEASALICRIAIPSTRVEKKYLERYGTDDGSVMIGMPPETTIIVDKEETAGKDMPVIDPAELGVSTKKIELADKYVNTQIFAIASDGSLISFDEDISKYYPMEAYKIGKKEGYKRLGYELTIIDCVIHHYGDVEAYYMTGVIKCEDDYLAYAASDFYYKGNSYGVRVVSHSFYDVIEIINTISIDGMTTDKPWNISPYEQYMIKI